MDSEEDERMGSNLDYRRDSSSSSGAPQNKSPSSDESDSWATEGNLELSEQQRIEFGILQGALKLEKVRPYQEQITRDVVEKIEALQAAAKHKGGEELVNVRIQSLALNKLLVLNYGKSDFRLVLAHYHLAQAYLSYDCLQQAIEHLTLALHKNQKLAADLPSTQLLQIHIHIALAEAYIAQHNNDDAIDVLTQAKVLQRQYNDGVAKDGVTELAHNPKILVLKAQCLTKQSKFEQALSAIDEVLRKAGTHQSTKVEYAFALVEKAGILAEMEGKESLQKAVEFQQEGINLLVNANYSKPEEVAQLYDTLSRYYERIGNSESALTCIQKVKMLYEQLYSPEDKRVIKARRKIATALLKNERYKEAVTELLEIVKLQEKVFGETLQLGRTLKLLGTVYSSLGIGDAKVYLRRAMAIFQGVGNRKQVLEIKEKLKNLMMERPAGEIDPNIISEQSI